MTLPIFARDTPLVSKVVPAKYGYTSRKTAPKLLMLHCTTGAEKGDSAENVAQYFRTTKRPASAHYVVDTDSVVQCLDEEWTAFGCKGANSDGIHIELCGKAEQTRQQWLDEASSKIWRRAVALVEDITRRRGITVVMLGKQQLNAGKRTGITTHAAYDSAFPSSGHWDPGPNFPIMEFIGDVRELRKAHT